MSNLLEGFTAVAPVIYDSNGKPIGPDYDFSNLQQDFSEGRVFFRKGDKIQVEDQAGNITELPSERFLDATNEGYKLDTPEAQYQRALIAEYTTPSAQAKAAALAAARGISIGLSDPLIQAFGGNMEKVKALDEANPDLSVAGEVVGGALPLVLSGGGSAVAKAGATALKYTPAALATGLGRAAESAVAKTLLTEGAEQTAKSFLSRAVVNAAPKIAGAAAEGALYGAGNALSESSLGNAELNAEYLASNIGMGSFIGAAFGGGLGVAETMAPEVGRLIDSARNKVGSVGKKAVSNMLGVEEQFLDKYIARKGQIDLAEGSLDDMILENKDKVDSILNDFKESKLNLKDSTQALREAKNNYLEDLRSSKNATAENVAKAKEVFKEAEENLIKTTDASLLDAGAAVAQDLDKLHQEVVVKSNLAMQVLKDEDTVIPLSKVFKTIDDMVAENSTLATQESKMISEKLNKYKDNLSELAEGGVLKGENAKKQIQALDKITTYDHNATSFDKVLNSSFKKIRYEMDSVLKEASPAYKEAMKSVSDDVSLLNSLKRYGDEFESSRALRNIKDPVRVKYELSAIKKLEDRFGSSYTKNIDNYLEQKALIKELPEYKAYRSHESQLAELEKKLQSPNVQASLRDTQEFKDLLTAQSEAKKAALVAKGLGDIKGASIPGIFKKAALGDKIAISKVKILEKELNSPALSKMIEDAGILRAFDKSFTRGSKNTNLYAGIGLLAGHLFDSTVLGGGIGAVVGGALIDNGGPKIAKMLVDKYIALSAIEKSAANMSKMISTKINSFIGTKSLGQAVRERALPAVIQNRDEKEKKQIKSISKKTPEQVQNTYKKIYEVVSNENALANKLSIETAQINKYAPNISNAIQMKAANAVSFLKAKIPKINQFEHALKITSRPSDYELYKFNKYWEAVDNPMSVFDNLENGIVSPEQVETLKTVYPEMYNESVKYLVENITELQKDLPYDKRLVLSQFFGVPLDPSMGGSMVMQLQQNMSPASQQETAIKAQGGTVNSYQAKALGRIDLESKMTDVERIARG